MRNSLVPLPSTLTSWIEEEINQPHLHRLSLLNNRLNKTSQTLDNSPSPNPHNQQCWPFLTKLYSNWVKYATKWMARALRSQDPPCLSCPKIGTQWCSSVLTSPIWLSTCNASYQSCNALQISCKEKVWLQIKLRDNRWPKWHNKLEKRSMKLQSLPGQFPICTRIWRWDRRQVSAEFSQTVTTRFLNP